MTVLEVRVAREFDVVKIKLTPEVKEHLRECEEKNLCRFCREPLADPSVEKPTRGCHKACAGSLYHLIDSKARDKDGNLITNEYLLKNGSWLYPKPPGRKSANPAVNALLGNERK